MIEFKELKVLIQKASRINKVDIANMFSFEIDVDNLEEMLTKKSDLHVLDLGSTPGVIESRVPEDSDYSLISEYVYRQEAFNTIFDGKSQIANLIIYCDCEGKNTVELSDEEKATGKYSKKTLNYIMSEFPVYRTLIVRTFNTRDEKFEYLIYFRSNRVMINYIKALRESGEFENATGEVDNIKNTPYSND